MPNDTEAYPADSFDNMKAFAARYDFSFPYVVDTTLEVAEALAQSLIDDWLRRHQWR
jgi:hypothetical protein